MEGTVREECWRGEAVGEEEKKKKGYRPKG